MWWCKKTKFKSIAFTSSFLHREGIFKEIAKAKKAGQGNGEISRAGMTS